MLPAWYAETAAAALALRTINRMRRGRTVNPATAAAAINLPLRDIPATAARSIIIASTPRPNATSQSHVVTCQPMASRANLYGFTGGHSSYCRMNQKMSITRSQIPNMAARENRTSGARWPDRRLMATRRPTRRSPMIPANRALYHKMLTLQTLERRSVPTCSARVSLTMVDASRVK